jgi:hypothetical protein
MLCIKTSLIAMSQGRRFPAQNSNRSDGIQHSSLSGIVLSMSNSSPTFELLTNLFRQQDGYAFCSVIRQLIGARFRVVRIGRRLCRGTTTSK